METKHTPGPWKLRRAKYKSEHDFIMTNESQNIAAWSFHDGVKSTKEKSEHIANARLIAAAPDLLKVLQELRESADYWGEYDVPVGIVAQMDAAIAKATSR